MFEAAVDGLRRSVRRAGAVEVSQDVTGPSAQGASEGDELGQGRWDVVAEVLDVLSPDPPRRVV